jgi:hypothetical protein
MQYVITIDGGAEIQLGRMKTDQRDEYGPAGAWLLRPNAAVLRPAMH